MINYSTEGMRLQELKKTEMVQQDEAMGKHVRIFLQSAFYLLTGNWQWELEADAVFCSDVMFSLQEEFAGTKAIFHPDDVAAVKESLCSGSVVPSLTFRIITTYGEVKTITGKNLAVAQEPMPHLQDKAVQAAVQSRVQKNNLAHLQLLKEISATTNRFIHTGQWYYNAATHHTWYADFVYQMHGLPPQSLNAHLHTFHPFVHPEDKALVMEFLGKALQRQTPLHMEYRIVANETEKWVSYQAQWFRTEKGEDILGGLMQDITEQKAAGKELESYQSLVRFQRQQALFDEQQINFGHWQISLLTRKAVYSDQFYRIFGLKPHLLPTTTGFFLNYVHPDDRERIEAAYRQIIYEHAVPDLAYRIVRSDGKTRYILQKAKLVMADNEMVVVGVIQDITVQRLLEKKVAELNDALHIQAWVTQQSDEMADMVTWVMDLQEGSVQWSESFYKLAGYYKIQAANLTGKTIFSFVHPHDLKIFQQQWNLAVQQQQASAFEVRFLLRGAVHFMKVVFTVYQHKSKAYFAGILRNVTAKHVLQQQLSQRVQLAESLSENTLDRVLITDAHNTILLWNRACEEAYGMKKAEAVGQNFYDLFPQLKTEAEMQLFSRVQKGEKVVLEGLASVFGKGYANLYLMPLYHQDDVYGILHIIHDVTREVELRNSLHDRLQLIEGLVQSSVDRIVVLDKNLNYLYWNKEAEAYYGISKGKVVGRNILEVFPGFHSDPGYAAFRTVLKGETVYLPAQLQKDSNEYFETYLIPVKDGQEKVTAILWVVHDLHNERQLQQEQRRASHILDTINELYIELDADGIFRYINRKAEEMWQVNKADLLGKNIWEVFPQAVGTGGYQFVQKARTEKQATAGEYFSEVLQRWMYMSAIPTADGVVVLFHDITEIREARCRLAEEHRRLKEAQAIAHIGSFEWLAATNEMNWSDEMYRIHDLEPQSIAIAPQDVFPFLHPDDEAQARAILANCKTKACSHNVVHRLVTQKGRQKVVSCFIQSFADEAGRVTQICGTVQDITAQRRMEEQLKDQSHYLRRITETVPDMISVMELPSCRLHYLNTEAFAANGFDPDKLVKMSKKELMELVHPDDQQTLIAYYHQLSKAGDEETVTAGYRALDGGGQWQHFHVRGKVFQRNAAGNVTEILNVVENITERKNAEDEVRKHLAILQQTEEMAQAGSWEYAVASGTFTWSEGMYRLFGLPQGSSVQPEVYLDFALEEDRSIARRMVKKLRKSNQPFEETLRIVTPGGLRTLKIKASVVHNQKGKAERIIGVDMDITGIREAEEKVAQSRHWLEQMALASPDSISVYDLQAKQPVYLNNCLAEWIGTTSEELVNMGIDGRLQLVHADDRLRLLHFQAKIKAAGDGEILHLDYRLSTRAENLLWLRNRSKVFQRDEHGKVTHILSVLQDVTEEKEAEQMLKGLNASLEKKNQELEGKNEEITSFAFVASHDLKEPLRKIHTFSDWLLTRETSLSETGQQTVERLAASVKRLNLLINDILALTKVHAGTERLKTIDLNRLLQQVKEAMQEKLQASNAVVEAAPLPALRGAVNQLFFLFKNLLANAIKFQPPGSQPRIRIHAENDGSFFKLSFTDNGLGIAQEHHKKIFEVFRRLHNNEEHEGTGMGLAICKKIMEKHGGKITVASAPGKGATFTCWFPAALASYQAEDV